MTAHVLVLSVASSYFREIFVSDKKEQLNHMVDFSNDRDITSRLHLRRQKPRRDEAYCNRIYSS